MGIVLRKGESIWDHVYTIDLHIEEIRESHINMNGQDIIISQLSFFKDKLREVDRRSLSEFVVIHGVGTGILRMEVEKILDLNSDYIIEKASSLHYGDGATFVTVK
ncbi:MAG: Smr/MutS family protein [Flavobacteriales bacterium]|nr:Smr/MutS family protein [Flavobacteriales bacterium]